MKHTFIALICLSLSVLLIGCGRQSETPGFTQVTETTMETASAAEDLTLPSQDTVIPEISESTEIAATTEGTVNPTSETEATATIPVCDHEWKFKVTKQPSCTATGIRTYTCQKCGSTYNENIPLLDHAYVISERKADCTNSGSITKICKVCQHTETKETQPKLGHAYGDLKTLRNPTELLPGLAEHTCTRCQFTEQITLPKLNPEK